MPTGNDGLLLRQCCELAALHALLRASGSQRFHVFCTHAAAPFVCWDPSLGVQLSRTLNLAQAQNKPLPAGTKLRTSPIIDALASLRASPDSYPNSARILDHAAKQLRVSLTGVLVDSDPVVEQSLREAFPPPSFRVFGGDWRKPMARYRSYDAPWLFTSTPGAFTLRAAPRAAAEMRAIAEHVDRVLVPAGHPGVVSVFYEPMDEPSRAEFWGAAVDAFGQHDAEFVAVPSRAKGKLHVGVLVATAKNVLAPLLGDVRASLQTVDPV
jgi:hypothetical protein